MLLDVVAGYCQVKVVSLLVWRGADRVLLVCCLHVCCLCVVGRRSLVKVVLLRGVAQTVGDSQASLKVAECL